jgi:thiamine-phosphate pyrophosphorylase
MIGRLQYITHDPDNRMHEILAEESCIAGIKWIQLRMKNVADTLVEEVAGRLKHLCSQHGAKLIINDNLKIALAAGADGVHLGKSDMDVYSARKQAGSSLIIGGTANTLDDIRALSDSGADYIGLGPFRFTSTKEKLSPVLGIEGYYKIMNECSRCGINVPIIAIGGITENDVAELFGTGIHGIAVSGAIGNSANKQETILNIQNQINHATVTHSR